MWFAESPSNIAIIKYMGKYALNIPGNKSLSYTINRFKSRVELELIEGKEDKFTPLENIGYLDLQISNEGVQRFLSHLHYLKNVFACKENFIVKSANNFPNDTGIASSASSFAALTTCALNAFCDILKIDMPNQQEMSRLSRFGSGSSCRSFFAPWAAWESEYAEEVNFPFQNIFHQIALVAMTPKIVPSSKAHIEVLRSLLYEGRASRAARRFNEFVLAMEAKDWEKGYIIAWQEFFDMHALFCTSSKPFWYMNSGTLCTLRHVSNFWDTHHDGPIVTVDAGPNVHFLWRDDQKELATEFADDFEFELM